MTAACVFVVWYDDVSLLACGFVVMIEVACIVDPLAQAICNGLHPFVRFDQKRY
jgi:hypothetical protein